MAGAKTPVVFRQRAGLRGVAFEVMVGVLYVPLALLLNARPDRVVMIAVGGLLLRLLLFSGPHVRRVRVDDRSMRFGLLSVVPLADIVSASVVTRKQLRVRNRATAEGLLHSVPGPGGGVVLEARTPEGYEYFVGLTVDEPEAFVRHVESVMGTAVRPGDEVETQPAPKRVRQGYGPVAAPALVALAAAADAAMWFGPAPLFLGLSILSVALVAWSSRREVRFEQDALRVGRARWRWDDVESVRCAPFRSTLHIERGAARQPFWGPRWIVIILLRQRPEGEPVPQGQPVPRGPSVRERTVIVGVPYRVEVPALATR